jgi:hypothetical protein
MLNILLRLKTLVGLVATRTTERYRVKVVPVNHLQPLTLKPQEIDWASNEQAEARFI